MKMSIVIPVYGCCKSLVNLYERLTKSISLITDNFEIIMINDSSPDSAWEVIKELAQKDDRVKGIKLSRNFGQHKAISAGLDYANGDWIIVMDCDLQDQPEEIIKLYNKVQEGYDIVFGKKIERKDRYFKRLGSKLFFKIYDYFTDSKVDSTVGNFSIISKKVLSSLTQMREQTKAYPLFVNWIGFRKTEVLIEHSERKEGESSYDMKKLVNLAIDNIVSQSNKPLKLSIKFGFILSIFSLLYGSWLIFRYFMFSIPVEGWTSVMVSIYFIGGLLFANMGILGLYIGKIFDETKNRPIYIIQETTFDK
ncbi:glycosyltransferase family 2 protein [Aliarcobacter butzleri]|uniref:glycosyltransferase family 2 protein n=1 Tax=Aliarcobacter butzleri TaxID=28197 RepID=UPI00215B54E1|nr:glycosyltransferase family 2 protein [Aliarcobacter butzleri]MCR8710574.1 glycosyltransferase family 2 protein [Aliarcobacter butzleri]